jgi:hypothetical protein
MSAAYIQQRMREQQNQKQAVPQGPAYNQQLYSPPPGGPMSFGPPQGQPPQGPMTSFGGQPGPNTRQLGSGSTGGYQYSPNPFSGAAPMQQPPLQPQPTPGRMQIHGAQPNPQLANQQAQIAALRGRQVG